MIMTQGKKYAVFSIHERKGHTIWTRAGAAWVNKDGSVNVTLDVLPLDGKLHVREVLEKRDDRPANVSAQPSEPQAAVAPPSFPDVEVSLGGH